MNDSIIVLFTYDMNGLALEYGSAGDEVVNAFILEMDNITIFKVKFEAGFEAGNAELAIAKYLKFNPAIADHYKTNNLDVSGLLSSAG